MACSDQQFSTSNANSGDKVTGVWVRVPVMTRVSLSKMLYYINCFSLPTGMTGVPARVGVDIVFEKALGAPPQPRAVYSPES